MSQRPCERCGRPARLRVVVDTNVWVSALVNPDGAPGLLALAARNDRFDVVATWELVDEFLTVVTRPKLRRYRISPGSERQILVLLARALPSVEMDIPLRDPDDTVVVAASVFGRADAIVTGDRGLLDDTDLRAWLGQQGIEVLTPTELLERLA